MSEAGDAEPSSDLHYSYGNESSPDHAALPGEAPADSEPAVVLLCTPVPPHTPLYAGANLRSLLDYDPAEITGRASFWTDCIHGEDIPQLLSGFFHLFTRGYHLYEYRFRNKDGSFVPLLAELHLHRHRRGAPSTLVCFLRRPVKEDTLWQEAGVHDGAARLTIDGRHRIADASPQIEAICGLPPARVIGKFALELIPPDYAHQANAAFIAMIQQGRPAARFWHAVKHQDGSLRFVANRCAGRQDRRGERAIDVLCRDITGLVTIDAKTRKRCTAGLVSAVSRRASDGPSDAGAPLDRLTRREREILNLTIDGLTSAEIGERLLISPRTVEAHRAHVMHKLGVRSFPQLVRFMVSCVDHPDS